MDFHAAKCLRFLHQNIFFFNARRFFVPGRVSNRVRVTPLKFNAKLLQTEIMAEGIYSNNLVEVINTENKFLVAWDAKYIQKLPTLFL